MKAIVRERYGSADVLRLSEVEVPEVADDEVLVRVRCWSANVWGHRSRSRVRRKIIIATGTTDTEPASR